MADNTRKRKEDGEVVAVAKSVEYRLYSQRWVQLFLLSGLALISDWVCFATAAVPREFAQATGGHTSASLINFFFVANVISCFMYTDVSRKYGLRKSTTCAAALMSLGCLCRSGIPGRAGTPPYAFVLVGTTCVGIAQPFFQCAPPLLSATWFSKRERSLATATALNANQLGIAAAFVVGSKLVKGQAQNMRKYLGLITLCSSILTGLTAFLFKERPPTPPTASAATATVDDTQNGLTFHRSLYTLVFRTKGFCAPLAAFVTSIAVTNVLSAFAGDYLDRAGARVSLATVGVLFQVAIVAGGVVLGHFVDSTRAYKSTTLFCLGVAVALLLVLGVACGYDAQVPSGLVVSAILALGAAVGPVQPINAELAVEVTHPFDENAVEAVQQLAGNLVSALLVPVYQAAAVFDFQVVPMQYDAGPMGRRYIKKQLLDLQTNQVTHKSIANMGLDARPRIRDLLIPEPPFLSATPHDARGDSILLIILVAATLSFFASFNFELKRAKFDDGPKHSAVELA